MRCILCENATIAAVLTDTVKGDPNGHLRVVSCARCGHVQLDPPTYDLEFYEDDSQVGNVVEIYGTPVETLLTHSWVEARRRVARFDEKGIPLKSVDGEGTLRLLDVGGGYGFFASAVLDNAPDATVVVLEPSGGRVEKGKSYLRDTTGASELVFETRMLDEAYVKEHRHSFDIVTMWHVLEHVLDPVQLLRNALAILKPGGTLCVEVPNLNDELKGLSPAFERRSFMVEHISYFSPDVLELVGRRAAPDAIVSVHGYQRYGIFNYFHWIHFNEAQGKAPDLLEGKPRFWLEENWKTVREAARTSDALFMVVRKAT